jgi:hypothetical protein
MMGLRSKYPAIRAKSGAIILLISNQPQLGITASKEAR